MDFFSAATAQQYRESLSPRSMLHHKVVEEVVSTIGTPIDERDRAAELNILCEYYEHAYEFATQFMCFDDNKTASVLNVARAMVSYDVFKPADQQLHAVAAGDQQEASRGTFQKMQKKLMSLQGVFSTEEIIAISEYFVHSYISSLRLWTHALSNKQQSETKVCMLYIEEPLPTLPLSKAVERIKLPKEEIASERDGSHKQRFSSRQSTKQMPVKETKMQEVDSGKREEKPETMDEMIEKASEQISKEAERREVLLEKALDEARGKRK